MAINPQQGTAHHEYLLIRLQSERVVGVRDGVTRGGLFDCPESSFTTTNQGAYMFQVFSILLLTLGTVGTILSMKYQWHSGGRKFVYQDMFVSYMTMLGAILCMFAFGWKGLVPILFSVIVASAYRSYTHAAIEKSVEITAHDIATNSRRYRKAQKQSEEYRKYMIKKYGKDPYEDFKGQKDK